MSISVRADGPYLIVWIVEDVHRSRSAESAWGGESRRRVWIGLDRLMVKRVSAGNNLCQNLVNHLNRQY